MMHDYTKVQNPQNPFNDPTEEPTTHGDVENSGARSYENFSSDNSRTYSPRRQIGQVAKRRIWGLAGTVLLVTLTIAILRIWEQKKYVPPSSKTLFNFFSTVLSIALGLNFSEALKGLAKVIRWRILAHESHTVRETDLILSSDSFLAVANLAKESRTKPRIWTLCCSWILFFLCAQAAISLVTLTYDFNGGSDYNSTYVTVGQVVAPDLSCYYHNQTCAQGPRIRQGIAHSYGQLVLSSDCGPYNDISEVFKSKNLYDYYCRRTPGKQQFAYRFLEFNPNDTRKAYPWMTDRVITAESGPCLKYHAKGKPTPEGARSNYTYTNSSGYTGWIDIPNVFEDYASTTYIYRGYHQPEDADLQKCGPPGAHCMTIWAHRNGGGGQTSMFYQCPITVSDVSNVKYETQKVSSNVSLLAAASIGINGRGGDDAKKDNWQQYQYSPFGSAWEIHYKDADSVGANMAEFAIGSIAYMANRNPHISFQGNLTHLGQALDPHWQSAIPLLAVIIGAHVAIYATAIYASQHAVIKDDSMLAIARLLRPLVEVFGDTGTFMTGKEMSSVISQIKKFQDGVVYGPRRCENSEEYSLDLADDIPTVHGSHAGGTYR